MKVAIYLCGHGPYREPRLIEMQHLRILRYCEALEKRLDISIDIEEVYVDINFPRSNLVYDLNNLIRLLEDIKEGKIDTVIVDIEIGASFEPYKYYPIISNLENLGAKVYNCYYDDEDASLYCLRDRYGGKVQNYHLPDDGEEMIALFPTLMAKVTYDVLEPILSTDYEDVSKEIHLLREKNPYKSPGIPWLSHKTKMELFRLREEEIEERKNIEDIFILGPNEEGVLWEENLYHNIREKESFKYVLSRIENLGFQHNADGRINSFIMEYGDYILYADPRYSGCIRILVYKDKFEEKMKVIDNKFLGSFKILDSWKNDLKEKIATRVEGLINK